MSKRVLILEDDFNRIFTFKKNLVGLEVYVEETALGAINKLENESWDLLLLDHDLGGQQMVNSDDKNTGSEVARWLNEHPDKKPPTIILHSFNPTGIKNMKSLLPESAMIPGIWTHLTSEMILQDGFSDLVKKEANFQNRCSREGIIV